MGAEQGVSVLCNRGFVGVATLPVNRIDAMDPTIYDPSDANFSRPIIGIAERYSADTRRGTCQLFF